MQENNVPKKKGGCLKTVLIGFLAFMAIGVIIAMVSSGGSKSGSGSKGTGSAKKSNDSESYFDSAKSLFESGSYIEAMDEINRAIKIDEKAEYEELKAQISAVIEERKQELEQGFSIEDDKVENIQFIKPNDGITQGLVFYPYIGVKESKKYMYLRVGYQEQITGSSLFVFTSIKVRAGEELRELKYNIMDKKNNADILGSGMTEVVDIKIKSDILEWLETSVLNTEEVLVRFEDISNKATDYTLSDEQKQVISNILEYYSYLD